MLATRIAELEHRVKVLEISGLWTSEDTDLSELIWSEGWREGGVSSSLVMFVTCSAALSAPSSVLPQTKLPSQLKNLEPLSLNCMRPRAMRKRRRGRRRRRESSGGDPSGGAPSGGAQTLLRFSWLLFVDARHTSFLAMFTPPLLLLFYMFL